MNEQKSRKLSWKEILQRARASSGASNQKELAKLLGMSESNLTNFLKKRRNPPYDKFVIFAMTRQISLDWLFYGETKSQIVEVTVNQDGEVRGRVRWSSQ